VKRLVWLSGAPATGAEVGLLVGFAMGIVGAFETFPFEGLLLLLFDLLGFLIAGGRVGRSDGGVDVGA